MPDQILIRGLRLRCHIGVPAEERRDLQTLRAHLTISVPQFSPRDDIGATIDYQTVSEEIQALALCRERHLIETLAQEIASHLLDKFPASHVKVEIEKEILPETDWVGVVIERGVG